MRRKRGGPGGLGDLAEVGGLGGFEAFDEVAGGRRGSLRTTGSSRFLLLLVTARIVKRRGEKPEIQSK